MDTQAEPTAGISYEYHEGNHEVSHGYLFPIVSGLLSHVPAGASVLDLGCGNGSFLSLFQGKGWRLFGTDFSPSGIEIAKRSYPEIEFALGDASNPVGPFRELTGSFDAVVSTEVIEHLYDPRGFVRNAYSLLKPSGVFVLTTPYHGYLKNLLLAVTGQMDKHFTVLWDHGHIKFWSNASLRTVLEEAGFTQVEFGGAGRLPYLWKSTVVRARVPAERSKS